MRGTSPGTAWLRTGKLRAGLSALGIAIGVAAIVAVLGLSASSQNGLLTEISQLGTNLLTVQDGQSQAGGPGELPDAAPVMVGRLPGVTAVEDTGTVGGVSVYRSPLIPAVHTNGLNVAATSLGLPAAAGTSVARGTYLNAATAREPVAVLGAAAAAYLGIDRIWPGERIWLGGMWFYVSGVLKPAPPHPPDRRLRADRLPAAGRYLGYDGHPSTIYLRTQPSRVTAVDNLLAAQASPEDPEQAAVAQPSAALTAQADVAGAFNGLFLALGAVVLLAGAVGVANIMVISVLERRSEIGLRRALGATRAHIRVQFLSEAVLLALLGGAAGAAAGSAATAIYATGKGWAVVIPPLAWAGGLGAALLIGAIAGLLPAPQGGSHVTYPRPFGASDSSPRPEQREATSYHQWEVIHEPRDIPRPAGLPGPLTSRRSLLRGGALLGLSVTAGVACTPGPKSVSSASAGQAGTFTGEPSQAGHLNLDYKPGQATGWSPPYTPTLGGHIASADFTWQGNA